MGTLTLSAKPDLQVVLALGRIPACKARAALLGVLGAS